MVFWRKSKIRGKIINTVAKLNMKNLIFKAYFQISPQKPTNHAYFEQKID